MTQVSSTGAHLSFESWMNSPITCQRSCCRGWTPSLQETLWGKHVYTFRLSSSASHRPWHPGELACGRRRPVCARRQLVCQFEGLGLDHSDCGQEPTCGMAISLGQVGRCDRAVALLRVRLSRGGIHLIPRSTPDEALHRAEFGSLPGESFVGGGRRDNGRVRVFLTPEVDVGFAGWRKH